MCDATAFALTDNVCAFAGLPGGTWQTYTLPLWPGTATSITQIAMLQVDVHPNSLATVTVKL
jgi:hypothetical protein